MATPDPGRTDERRRGDEALSGQEILGILRRVRARWRLRVLLRGLAALAAFGLAVLLVSAWGLDHTRFAPEAVVALRWAVALVVLVGFWLLVVRPLRQPVPDERIALYLEEHEPGLDGTVLAALAALREREDGTSDPGSGLSRAVLDSALARARATREGRRIERRSLGRSSGVLAASALVTLLLVFSAPPGLRHGAGVLLNPSIAPGAATPYSIQVVPGDVTIPRGADQLVEVRLIGFSAEGVALHRRPAGEASFADLGMVPADTAGGFELLLFGVSDVTEYFVESGGVRSPVYRISVEDLPYVEALELTYRFPAHTELEARVVERGGDIAVLRGTTVELRASTTLPTGGGRILLDDGEVRELRVEADGRLVGDFTVTGDGTYQIELDRPGGTPVPGSPRYVIRALSDQAPLVSFTRPGRDTRPSPIEEVFLEAKAEDDFGVRGLELIYSVNGGEERTVPLFGGGTRSLREVVAGHTLYLEEYGLEPGDVVAYYARARDGSNEPALSDLYFLQMRPFGLDYRQGDEPPGGGGGQGQEGGAESALSEQQRQVISAAFNLRRDRPGYSPEEFRQGTVTVGVIQRRLIEQVNTLLERMGNRGAVALDEGFRRVAESLPRGIEEMDAAAEALEREDLDGALPPAQRALQHLLRAEEAFREVTVTQGAQGGGGGGGEGAARDLADLFELELDQLRNQYETVQRAQQQSVDRQVDETLERLKELARRQEQEAERQRERARSGAAGSQGATSGSGGQNQQALADETEEAARQLERLAREQSRPELQETARRLQEAADAMRRSAAGGGEAGAGAARAAVDRLDEARRRLERAQADRVRRDTGEALRRGQQLASRQRRIEEELGRLDEATGTERMDRLRRLADEKAAMADEVLDLERQLRHMEAEARREKRPDVAEELAWAREGLREDQLADRIRFSRGLLGTREREYARAFEGEIGRAIDELRERLAEADRTAARPGPRDVASQAVERARDLVRGAESMEERARERGQGAPGEAAGGGGGADGRAHGRAGGRADGTSRPPEGLSDEDVRQMRREARERMQDAETLGRELAEAGVEAGELGDVVRSLRALDDARAYRDLEELARLHAQLLEASRRFEYALRRELDPRIGESPQLTGAEEIPEGYRRWVEEYYRALSRGGGGR